MKMGGGIKHENRGGKHKNGQHPIPPYPIPSMPRGFAALTDVGVPGGRGRPSTLKVVEHGAVEGRRSPGGGHFGAHVGRVGAGVGATEAPAVLLPPVSRKAQGAAVSRRGLPGRGGRDGGAGGEGEPR